MVRLSISPNKEKHKVFLKEYNKIIFDKNDEFIFDWETINEYANSIFYESLGELKNTYFEITEIEEKIVILLMIGFTPSEISTLLNKSIHTIYKYNSNIRKKLNISEDTNITNFISKKSKR